jgi:hypothetical protein
MKRFEVIYNTHDKACREKESSAELRECPFCGSENLEVCNTHTPSFWVACLDCGSQAHGQHYPGNYQRALESAVTAWNLRYPRGK